jgi:hypothetical protein
MCQKGAWKAVAAKDLPEELRGAYVRTGPNPTSWDPYDERYHWFDGDGLVHVVKLGADKVTFNCDYVKTAKYTVENKDPQKPMACFPRVSEGASSFSGSPGTAQRHVMVRPYGCDLGDRGTITAGPWCSDSVMICH